MKKFVFMRPCWQGWCCRKGDQITNLWFEETPFEGDYAVKETEILKEARCQLENIFWENGKL